MAGQKVDLCRKGHNDWAFWNYSKKQEIRRYCKTCRKIRTVEKKRVAKMIKRSNS